MCGIVGFAGFEDAELLRRMSAAVDHRGPDGEGYHIDGKVGLGHRRLSIIDLETGDQPMYSEDEKIVLTDGELKFEGKSEEKDYQVNIEFFKPVDAEGSTYKVLPRSVQMHILKKDKEEEEFWPRLLKDKALEKNQVKVDWDRYVDEDEEEEGFDMSNLEGGMGMGGMPGGMPGGMGGMPGMGGMGGMPGMGGDMGGMDMEALVSAFGLSTASK